MGKAKSKSDLPSKICPVCNRPFTWRKKWAECWDKVKYCSERCRRRKSKIDKQIDRKIGSQASPINGQLFSC
ncbi:MAG: DUF2256 domain-containing protein [Cyanobacteriota bacterium]|nr:DUF2256 domain-containing protein [Cyanobacteriota bacterium]